MADNDSLPYDPRQKAEQIAGGHAYHKHVELLNQFSGRKKGKYGPELNIKTSSEVESRARFADHLYATMPDSKTLVFRGVNENTGLWTRDVYHNEATNTTIFVNRDDPDGGTSVRARIGKQPRIDDLLHAENLTRKSWGSNRPLLRNEVGLQASILSMTSRAKIHPPHRLPDLPRCLTDCVLRQQPRHHPEALRTRLL